MYKDIYNDWIKRADDSTVEELKKLNDEEDIKFRFGKNLSFGTAGMRGIIGAGTNMMNSYTVRRTTQGLADYIKGLGKAAAERGVTIAYDTRRFSREFAFDAAAVLYCNGIKVKVFESVRPVPMLSFAVRHCHNIAGIMITASHNPVEYNGYKVFGEDGAQMPESETDKVVALRESLGDYFSDKILYEESVKDKIPFVEKEVDDVYYDTILKLRLSEDATKKVGKNIKLVYTPVHGSGYIPVTKVLGMMGITPVLVEEQLAPDPNFSTVKVPNPEYLETLSHGIEWAKKTGADVVFGTDPDCDRLGVALKNDKGEFINLSGNQSGALLLDYILNRLSEKGALTEKSYVVKSYATTGLAAKIAEYYGVELFDVAVGFKYIGEKMHIESDIKGRDFVFGFEDSCGSIRGTQSRDKDAVIASMLFAEMACYYYTLGKTVYDRLEELYKKFGYVCDKEVSIWYKGLNAKEEMAEKVNAMREIWVDDLAGYKVTEIRDYKKGIVKKADGSTEKLDASVTNAVYYLMEDGSFVCVRPSGTEPRLRAYYSINGKTEKDAEEKFEKIKKSVQELER